MQHPNLFHTTVIQAKQEKSTFKKIKQQIHAENCKQECVDLTLAQPSAHFIDTDRHGDRARLIGTWCAVSPCVQYF